MGTFKFDVIVQVSMVHYSKFVSACQTMHDQSSRNCSKWLLRYNQQCNLGVEHVTSDMYHNKKYSHML